MNLIARNSVFQSHVSAFCLAGSVVFGLGSVLYYSLELTERITYNRIGLDGMDLKWPGMVKTHEQQFFSNSTLICDQEKKVTQPDGVFVSFKS